MINDNTNIYYSKLEFTTKTLKNINYLYNFSHNDRIENLSVSNGQLDKRVLPSFFIDKTRNYIEILITIKDCFKEIEAHFKHYPILPADKLTKIEEIINTVNELIINKIQSESDNKVKIPKDIFCHMLNIEKSIKKIKEQGSLNWVQQNCREMYTTLDKCNQLLKLSLTVSSLRKRTELSPRSTNGGASGSYFISSSIEDPKESERIIVKPAKQEHLLDFPGFTPGTNVLRESLAYILQNLLELDCGVPPTVISFMSHPMFEKEDKGNEILLKKFGIPLTKEQFLSFVDYGDDINSFLTNLYKFQDHEIEATLSELSEETRGEILSFAQGTGEATLAVRQADQASNLLFSNIRRSRTEEELTLKTARHLFAMIETPHTYGLSVVSCQLMVKNCVSLLDMNEAEIKEINPKEFEKIVVDLIMFNVDRHLGNLLAHKIPKDEFLNQLASQLKFDKEEFIQTLNDFSKETKNVVSLTTMVLNHLQSTIYNFKIDDHIEKNISNFIFAHVNSYDPVMQLVLIDHGNCLPDPDAEEVGNSSLDFARHDWMELPIISEITLSGSAKEKILGLNIPELVNKIQTAASKHEKHFGENCRLPKGCPNLLRINLLFLKNGVERDCNLNELNSFFKGSIKNIYKQVKELENRGLINWIEVETMINEIINKKIKRG